MFTVPEGSVYTNSSPTCALRETGVSSIKKCLQKVCILPPSSKIFELTGWLGSLNRVAIWIRCGSKITSCHQC